MFYVIYGVMNSMNACYFDVDNFLITAKDIKGSWSKPVYFRLEIRGKHSQFYWGYDGEHYEKIGIPFDTTKFSDEYCKYGEFTGTMVGITCADRVKHKYYADFDFFEYVAKEDSPVE